MIYFSQCSFWKWYFEGFFSEIIKIICKKLQKLCGPFLWMGFNCLKARVTSRRQFTFYHQVTRNSWYSLYWPQKDEKLSRPWSQQVVLNLGWPWSHPVVLNTGPLDWESSTWTSRPSILLRLRNSIVKWWQLLQTKSWNLNQWLKY